MISQEVLFDNAIIGNTPEVLNEIHTEDKVIAVKGINNFRKEVPSDFKDN